MKAKKRKLSSQMDVYVKLSQKLILDESKNLIVFLYYYFQGHTFNVHKKSDGLVKSIKYPIFFTYI